MTDIPDDIRERATELCAATIYASVDGVDAQIGVIASALLAERKATEKRWRDWAMKRVDIRTKFWVRAARAALNGDLRELRNRIELHDAGPVDVVLSNDEDAAAIRSLGG